MVWIHPALGITTALLIIWMGLVGINASKRRPAAAKARRLHARVAPWAGLLAGISAIAGTASVYFLRDDLKFAQSWHFRIGWTCALLSLAVYILSRNMRRWRWAPRLHLYLGLLLLGCAFAVAFLGLDMLP